MTGYPSSFFKILKSDDYCDKKFCPAATKIDFFLQEPFDDFVGIFLGGYRVFFQWISNENQVLQTGKLSQVFKLPPLSDILKKY